MEFSGNNFREYARKIGRNDAFINKLENYALNLQNQTLPLIFSPKHLALLMGKDYNELKELINSRGNFYQFFRIKKKSKGYRPILAPSGELKRVQYWIKTNILDKINFSDSVTAYQAQKSILDNARPHINKELIIKFDLRDFFNTIQQSKVYGIFQVLGYHKSVAVDLAKLCCVPIEMTIGNLAPTRNVLTEKFKLEKSVLPQGAPTSPTLSNLAGVTLDHRLRKYAEKYNYAYTRYADDLTFSGPIKSKLKKSVIKHIINSEGFLLNERKGSYAYKSNKQIVTGLTVNEKVSIPKKFRRKINTHLHNCLRFGPYNNLKKMKIVKMNYREWLLGNITFIHSIHPAEAKKMKEKFDQINWL